MSLFVENNEKKEFLDSLVNSDDYNDFKESEIFEFEKHDLLIAQDEKLEKVKEKFEETVDNFETVYSEIYDLYDDLGRELDATYGIVNNALESYDFNEAQILLKDSLEKINNFINAQEEETELIDKEINSIYNISEHYSNFDESKIGIDVKLHTISYPDLDDIKSKLLEQGYLKEDIDEEVTEELIEKYQKAMIENSWTLFDDLEIKNYEFLGADGRMGGYAIFKFEPETIDEIKSFSNQVEKLHKGVLEGLDTDSVLSCIISDEIILTEIEQQKRKKEQEFQDLRPYVIIQTPMNKFSITPNDGINVEFWDGDKGVISMDTNEIEIEEGNLLSGLDIYNGLQDTYFGVKSILGCDDLMVDQHIEVKKIFLDTKEEFISNTTELIYDGSVDNAGNLLDAIEFAEVSTQSGNTNLFTKDDLKDALRQNIGGEIFSTNVENDREPLLKDLENKLKSSNEEELIGLAIEEGIIASRNDFYSFERKEIDSLKDLDISHLNEENKSNMRQG